MNGWLQRLLGNERMKKSVLSSFFPFSLNKALNFAVFIYLSNDTTHSQFIREKKTFLKNINKHKGK
jgi:hypothetical protein